MDPSVFDAHSTVRYPDPDTGDLAVTTHWALVDGRREVVGVTICAGCFPVESPAEFWPLKGTAGPRRLEATEVRIRLAEVTEASRQRLVAANQFEAYSPGITARLFGWDQDRIGQHRLEDIAAVYIAAGKGGSRTPTTAVAQEFNVSTSTAGTWVQRARDAGHLPPTTKGRPTFTAPEGDNQ